MLARTIIALVTLGLVMALASGCATMGNKPEKSIDKTLASWKASLEKQDIDGMMASYSDKFATEEGGGKAQLKEFLTNAKDQGYLEGVKVDMSNMKIKLEKDTAQVGPIGLSSTAGSMTVNLVMKPDPDKVWRIVGSQVEQ